jgi:3alpha(or 20beta)-hydroxysteroid dehydrogenase
MSGRLEGKVALISGSASGQGEAEARLFASEGARVVVSDVEHAAGERVAGELGDAALYVPLDVADPEQWENAVDAATNAFGGLHVLVNNAGIGILGAFEELPFEEHQRLIDINLHGVFHGMRAARQAMIDAGGGSIVNISSIDGLVGVQGMASYSASKFAVTGLTRSTAIELGPLGIRVNSIHPGVISSPMVEQAPPEVHERLDRLMQKQPIKRMGTPEEVAYLALYLASDESSYCTGAQFVIDGGHLAGPWREPHDG